MRQQRRAGFTLVETVVVLMIVSIIIAISFPLSKRAVHKVEERSFMTSMVRLYNQMASPTAMNGRQTITQIQTGPGKLTLWHQAALDQPLQLLRVIKFPDTLLFKGQTNHENETEPVTIWFKQFSYYPLTTLFFESTIDHHQYRLPISIGMGGVRYWDKERVLNDGYHHGNGNHHYRNEWINGSEPTNRNIINEGSAGN